MGEVSNKALAALLVAAIVVSLGGTFISLNRLGQVKVVQFGGQTSPIGFVTSPNGTVNLSISDTLSIILDDSSINFGACSPTGGSTVQDFSDSANTAVCAGNVDSIQVRNNGNRKANVTVQTNATAAQFIQTQGGTSYYSFKSDNTTDAGGSFSSNCGAGGSTACYGGCQGNLVQATWINFSSTTVKYNVCTNLSVDVDYNSVLVYAMVGIPQDATSGGTAKLTFWAQDRDA